jgi:hypothetical protein
MKRKVEDWTVEKLHQNRALISFPEYQRQPNLWSDEKKALLIDSILRDIDIPKLYFNRTGDKGFEVVDGQQRLWAIWGFIDGQYPLSSDRDGGTYANLSRTEQDAIKNYKLQVTVFDDASDEYLRLLFLRLQLGLLLLTGEKLHAASGKMKDFVFQKLGGHPFVRALGMATRRYAKETLCAQVCINSFNRAKLGELVRTRYEDLISFFREYESPQGEELGFFRSQTKSILATLDQMWECFGPRSGELRNRSYILSIYLFFEPQSDKLLREKKKFVEFVFTLWKRLKEEARAGIDRKNRELYKFETSMSSAPGERYQIERRHDQLAEYWDHFLATGKIKGD